ncbi:MAG: hypothetical protein JWS10_1087 [Cypionkella sp.]|nr:hypothetical protein [Cypionkella sp.]
MIGGAEYYGGATLSEFHKDGIAPGNAMGMHDDGSDLIERDAADGLAAFLNFQKATVARKMAAITADIYDLIQWRIRYINWLLT